LVMLLTGTGKPILGYPDRRASPYSSFPPCIWWDSTSLKHFSFRNLHNSSFSKHPIIQQYILRW